MDVMGCFPQIFFQAVKISVLPGDLTLLRGAKVPTTKGGIWGCLAKQLRADRSCSFVYFAPPPSSLRNTCGDQQVKQTSSNLHYTPQGQLTTLQIHGVEGNWFSHESWIDGNDSCDISFVNTGEQPEKCCQLPIQSYSCYFNVPIIWGFNCFIAQVFISDSDHAERHRIIRMSFPWWPSSKLEESGGSRISEGQISMVMKEDRCPIRIMRRIIGYPCCI